VEARWGRRLALGPGLTIRYRDSRRRYRPKFASAAVGKMCEAMPSLTDSHLRLTVATTKSVAATSWLGWFGPSCIPASAVHWHLRTARCGRSSWWCN